MTVRQRPLRRSRPTATVAPQRRRRERRSGPRARTAAEGKPAARVLLVDDHAMIRLGLSTLLAGEPDLVVCGEASNGEDALPLVAELEPDLVILDLSLPGMTGRELLQRLRANHPDVLVLVLSLHDEALEAHEVLRAGARGYVMKHEAAAELLTAVRRVLAGGVHLSSRMSNRLLERAAQGGVEAPISPVTLLSGRERDVFEKIGRGIGTKEIASQLHISIKTVETYRAQIKKKLGIRHGTELTQRAVHWVQRL